MFYAVPVSKSGAEEVSKEAALASAQAKAKATGETYVVVQGIFVVEPVTQTSVKSV